MKTTSMENVSTWVLDKNKEHYLRSKDKAEQSRGKWLMDEIDKMLFNYLWW